MEHHRGLSHSILFAPVFAAFGTGILKLSVKNIDYWMVAVETADAAYQIFTSTFQDPEEYLVLEYPLIEPNKFIYLARDTDEVQFFKWFARLPVYEYYTDEYDHHVVEYYDLQFMFNPRLAERFNATSTRAPFVLRLTFGDDGSLLATDF
jgi:hypothetical protein